MARDYAKRYKTPPKRRGKQQQSNVRMYLRSAFVLIVLLLVIVAGGAGYYYYHHPAANSAEVAAILPPASDAETAPLKKAKNKAPVVEAKEEPVDYEFYTLLPKINVPDPVQNTTPPDEQPGYWLQMAVYYSMRDASAMLDRLQLLGLDPVITERKSSKADKTLYVVIMGPFSEKDAAVTRQQDLKKIGVTSYIFHVDPPVVAPAPTMPTAMAPSVVPVVDATPDDVAL